jgi:hypothetical protein
MKKKKTFKEWYLEKHPGSDSGQEHELKPGEYSIKKEMTKKAALLKVAKWNVHPTDAEDHFEGTNLNGDDRKKLKEITEKVRSKQGKFKKFLVNHPLLSSFGGATIGTGIGLGVSHLTDSNKLLGGYTGGAAGLLAGGLGSALAINSEDNKVYDKFENSNKNFLNRFYKNPHRAKFRNDRKANESREAMALALLSLASSIR